MRTIYGIDEFCNEFLIDTRFVILWRISYMYFNRAIFGTLYSLMEC